MVLTVVLQSKSRGLDRGAGCGLDRGAGCVRLFAAKLHMSRECCRTCFRFLRALPLCDTCIEWMTPYRGKWARLCRRASLGLRQGQGQGKGLFCPRPGQRLCCCAPYARHPTKSGPNKVPTYPRT